MEGDGAWTMRVCRLVYLGRPVKKERVDEAPGNAELSRQAGQLAVSGVPGGFGNLVGLQADIAARIVSHEADHQRMRKRPRLAAKVADLAHVEADFLVDFARHSLLE